MAYSLMFIIVFTFISTFFTMAFPMGVNVFILSGQSNMAGEGGVSNGAIHPGDKWDGVIPSQCKPNRRILSLNSAGEWEEAHEPLHGSGIGPGMPFATSLLHLDPAVGVIGLVPCAVPGSPITSWSRNSSLYATMLRRTHAALARGGVLRALLWYQGESDTRDRASAVAYRARMVELFRSFRHDLHSPSLPIIQVALASGFDFKEIVRRAQLHTKIANVKCVDAEGLELEPPSCNCKQHYEQHMCLHLSTPAQVKLGAMLAQAFIKG